jgi:hypothetical protein
MFANIQVINVVEFNNNIYLFFSPCFLCLFSLIHIQMPPKRKLKHMLPIKSATPPNSNNESLSPHEQGENSKQSHIPISTPSTAQSGTNRTTQSSVDPTDFVDTAEQEASNGMYAMILIYCGLILYIHHY